MAETQRQQLSRLITIVATYSPDKTPSELESAFLNLEELDQRKNIDLWVKLKSTLATNPALRDPDVLKFIRQPAQARKGQWWYDPNRWLPA